MFVWIGVDAKGFLCQGKWNFLSAQAVELLTWHAASLFAYQQTTAFWLSWAGREDRAGVPSIYAIQTNDLMFGLME